MSYVAKYTRIKRCGMIAIVQTFHQSPNYVGELEATIGHRIYNISL